MWDFHSLQRVNNNAHRTEIESCLLKELAKKGVRVSDEVRRKIENLVKELLPDEKPVVF